MRYHWGLGIGHTYSHNFEADVPEPITERQTSDSVEGMATEGGRDAGFRPAVLGSENIQEQTAALNDELEFGLADREKEDLGESDESGESEQEQDDEVFLAMEDMYGL